ncbi:MAG: HU family DNA-binding protein [Bacteroidales bacterium]|jgi:DNA-binding protein HU-beta|nr:HU family DNA-binding protein [Bacteroidales bacterium]
MNKAELITAMAEKACMTKVDAKAALEAFICATSGALTKGDKLALIGFGTFSVVQRPARKGRNPRTKKELMIPAKKVVKFKAGAELAGKV